MGRSGYFTDVLGLAKAIKRDQLTLEYQPKADMRTGRVLGVEALARWDHPRRGRIPPNDFIPRAERIPGAIKALTDWTLKAAMRQARAWQLDGHELTVAVNLSPSSLSDTSLVDTVGHLLSSWQIPPHLVQLELTETAVFGPTDPQRVASTLRELSDMGIMLALDDFGTGYSSLTRLRDLPIDKVKIDKAFVSHMDERPNDALIVRSVIALAKNLGLRVVAEGIETERVWHRLAELGCDVAQGNYLSPPLPPSKLIFWVRQWEELYQEAHRMAQELLERRDGPMDRRSGMDDRRGTAADRNARNGRRFVREDNPLV